jgi:hypothetical protein
VQGTQGRLYQRGNLTLHDYYVNRPVEWIEDNVYPADPEPMQVPIDSDQMPTLRFLPGRREFTSDPLGHLLGELSALDDEERRKALDRVYKELRAIHPDITGMEPGSVRKVDD